MRIYDWDRQAYHSVAYIVEAWYADKICFNTKESRFGECMSDSVCARAVWFVWTDPGGWQEETGKEETVVFSIQDKYLQLEILKVFFSAAPSTSYTKTLIVNISYVCMHACMYGCMFIYARVYLCASKFCSMRVSAACLKVLFHVSYVSLVL